MIYGNLEHDSDSNFFYLRAGSTKSVLNLFLSYQVIVSC
jgi:hypothetical protein